VWSGEHGRHRKRCGWRWRDTTGRYHGIQTTWASRVQAEAAWRYIRRYIRTSVGCVWRKHYTRESDGAGPRPGEREANIKKCRVCGCVCVGGARWYVRIKHTDSSPPFPPFPSRCGASCAAPEPSWAPRAWPAHAQPMSGAARPTCAAGLQRQAQGSHGRRRRAQAQGKTGQAQFCRVSAELAVPLEFGSRLWSFGSDKFCFDLIYLPFAETPGHPQSCSLV
jgi:hypothetical protein